MSAARRPPIGRWHSVEDVADLLNLSANTVRRHIDTGALVATNVAVEVGGCRWRISDRALEEFDAARSSRPVSA